MAQKTARDRITVELSEDDRKLLDLLKKPLTNMGLDVNDAKVLMGVFRRHGRATQPAGR
jgi:hypothetical protein